MLENWRSLFPHCDVQQRRCLSVQPRGGLKLAKNLLARNNPKLNRMGQDFIFSKKKSKFEIFLYSHRRISKKIWRISYFQIRHRPPGFPNSITILVLIHRTAEKKEVISGIHSPLRGGKKSHLPSRGFEPGSDWLFSYCKPLQSQS